MKMGVQPPYLYDQVKSEGPSSPYKEFDPKAVTRASQTPHPAVFLLHRPRGDFVGTFARFPYYVIMRL